jgi:hypothetical protein
VRKPRHQTDGSSVASSTRDPTSPTGGLPSLTWRRNLGQVNEREKPIEPARTHGARIAQRVVVIPLDGIHSSYKGNHDLHQIRTYCIRHLGSRDKSHLGGACKSPTTSSRLVRSVGLGIAGWSTFFVYGMNSASLQDTVTAHRGVSGLLNDHNAVPGTGRRRAVKEDPKRVQDAGKAQKIPCHDRRRIDPGTRSHAISELR